MLQAYCDESVTSSGDGRLFVMAGYIATQEAWAAFAREWANLLMLGPPHFRRINELKMAEMQSPLGLQQAELFYRVIERHLDTYVACVVRLEDVIAAWNEVKWLDWLDNIAILKNEYFLAFDNTIRVVAASGSMLGVHEPVDFIFDDHSQRAKCLRAWRITREVSPRSVRRLLGATPRFEDSKNALPLQAADLLAYYVREAEASYVEGSEYRLEFPWKRHKGMHGMIMFQTRELILRGFRNAILATQLYQAGLGRDQVEAVVASWTP
jgi:hypothetical protein